jgi:NAD(P)-dependent dehydrogenase (short-subunit alcohol dehydrogenase family)
MYVSCDVEDVAQIKNMFAKTMEAYGKLDIMFSAPMQPRLIVFASQRMART